MEDMKVMIKSTGPGGHGILYAVRAVLVVNCSLDEESTLTSSTHAAR